MKLIFLCHKVPTLYQEGWGIKVITIIAVLLLTSGACAEVEGYPPAEAQATDGCGSICKGPGTALPLVDLGSSGFSSWENRLWTVDAEGKRGPDLSLYLGSWSIEEIVPADRGYAVLLRRTPSGELRVRYLGYVYPGHRYRSWFCADSVGTHELWYKVGWRESSRIRFNVLGF